MLYFPGGATRAPWNFYVIEFKWKSWDRMRIENPRVGSSILSLGTIYLLIYLALLCFPRWVNHLPHRKSSLAIEIIKFTEGETAQTTEQTTA